MTIEIEALQKSYKQLSDLVGEETMLRIYEEYRGTQLNLPMKLYDREKSQTVIVKEYPRLSLKELSDKYGYSQRWIKKVIEGSTKTK